MRSIRNSASVAALLAIVALTSNGQQSSDRNEQTTVSNAAAQKVIVITGARFSYDLVEHWIEAYRTINPEVQIVVESRGSSDPRQYDILAEVYDHDDEIKKNREYINVARYAILPVARTGSDFAQQYAEKGVNNEKIKQIFFHNVFADQGKQKPIEEPFTVYTRMQKAGVPAVFAAYFGQEQKDIKGTGIAGADSHLLKALLRDSAGVSYLPLPLIYNGTTRLPIEGLTVLPVDLNGNKRVSDDEKFYGNLDAVITQLESLSPQDIHNIPVEYLHLSVDKQHASSEAIDFLKWVNENGQRDLHRFGYLKPESKRFEKQTFDEFATKRGR